MTLSQSLINLVILLMFSSHQLVKTQKNEAPIWEETLKNRLEMGINEDSPVGYRIGYLKAVDPEGSKIIYSVDSDTLNVNSTTGEVTLARLLDHENLGTKDGRPLLVKFRASEIDGPNSVDVTVTILVLDVNDNAPEFIGLPYNIQVPEGQDVNSLLYEKIQVIDKDSGYNAEVTLFCLRKSGNNNDDVCRKFHVTYTFNGALGITYGRVYLKQKLDYETKTSYIMTLMAKNNGNFSLNSTVNVHILVIDQQDLPPLFQSVPITFFVKENAPLNTSVGYITAQDGDAGNVRPIKIQHYLETVFRQTASSNLFLLAPTQPLPGTDFYSSQVFTNGKLDREEKSRYEFRVQAVEVGAGAGDRLATSISTVSVNVMDVNDNPPSFDQKQYSINVYEVKSAIGRTTIPYLTMTVTDPDEAANANFIVFVSQESHSGSAAVFPNVTFTNAATLYLRIDNKFLDYERHQYRKQKIMIKAQEIQTNELYSSVAEININLLPVNDFSPKFAENVYYVNVTENSLPLSPIAVITATDGDEGNVNHSSILYSLSGAHSSWFNVERKTGAIYLRRKLDYEDTKKVQLVYKASDQGQPALEGSVRFHVTVINVNDVAPKFTFPRYTAAVKETSTDLLPRLHIIASDTESGTSDVTYRIKSGNTADSAFVINRRSGALTLKRLLSLDEANNGRFVLVIEASDNGTPEMKSEVSVTIVLQDENNHAPVFTQLLYRGKVNETADVGDAVLRLMATDKDEGDNGKVQYKIQHKFDVFRVDSGTGLVSVKGALDYDTHKSYSFKAEARDTASPPRVGVTDVIIDVLDQNNKPPKFTEKSYFIEVDESVRRPHILKTLYATDSDGNSDLSFSIVKSSVRAIDPHNQPFTDTSAYDYRNALGIHLKRGEIFVNTHLKHKFVSRLTFTVEVYDINSITGLQRDQAQVTVSITETLDLRPFFDLPWTHQRPEYLFTIFEEGLPGSPVTTLIAMDPHSDGIKRIVNFEKIDSTDPQSFFSVRRETGEVVINQPIDFDSLPYKLLDFQVKAISSNVTRFSLAKISVQISDINDNSPIFMQPEYVFSIVENSNVLSGLRRVHAVDKDSGPYATIVYSILGQGAEHFSISKDGLVSVSIGVNIDRETKAEYNLYVQARDNPNSVDGSSRSTKVKMKVSVVDENDNAPRFLQANYSFYMVDTLPAHTSIGQVSAVDLDQFNNGQFIFTLKSIRNDNATKLISVHPTDGIVTIIDDPTRFAYSHVLLFDITARDFGNPSLESSVRMAVVRDTRTEDGKPVFIFPSKGDISQKIKENARIGTVVEVVEALSSRGSNKSISYSFDQTSLNRDYTYFRIHNVTGVITVNSELDREKQQDYELRIKARDLSVKPPLESVELLIIRLQDENDNRPVFGQPPCSTEFVTGKTKEVYVKENSVTSTEIVQVSACDRDIFPNNVITYRLVQEYNGTICDSRGLFRTRADDPSVIEISNSSQYLDFEKNARHLLCIEASDGVRGLRREITYISVNVLDVNDNGPIFGEKHYKLVIMDSISRGENILQLKTSDKDKGENAKVLYHVLSVTFTSSDGLTTKHPEAFSVHPLSGHLQTAMSPYSDFIGGYFTIQVIASDYYRTDMTDNTEISVMVIDETYNIRATVLKNENERADVNFKNRWTEKLNETLSKANPWDVSVTEVRYHKDDSDNVVTNKVDICFVAIESKSHKVVMGNTVEETLSSSRYFSNSTEVTIGACIQFKREVQDNRYWKVLIGLACFIFISTLILIIIVVIISRRLYNKMTSNVY